MSTATFAQKIAREDEPLQSRRPEASLIDWLLGGAVALFAIAWVWPFFSYCFLGGQDEGIILQGSARILRGEIPEFTCLLGTMVQEAYDTHPDIRAACDGAVGSARIGKRV